MLGSILFRFLATLSLLTAADSALSASSVLEGSDGWLFPGWEHLDQVDTATQNANLDLIKEASDRLTAKQIGLVLLLVPAKAEFYPDRLSSGVTLAPAIKARYGGLLAALKQRGIATFDDAAVLRQVENGKDTAFYRADYHWTAQAAEASADATAALLQQQWHIEADPKGGAVLGEWVNERRFGDLANNFMSAQDRKRIGRDTYTIRKAAANGGDLLGGGPAPVLVVGNSFVQPYLGFSQKLSNTLGQNVALTWNPGNIGPWQTMLDAVEGKSFVANKPKVVVWQFNEAQLEQGPAAAEAWDAKGVMTAMQWKARFAAALDAK
ncbi:MAG: twin-arginine translocation pathway signal [Burkholderiaceae bacterium]|jgi:alginate O-acetyltransferase complex protein AlgJ|nr:twin-arginine translocation pathway signal [Burkholderiaceae bacterium]